MCTAAACCVWLTWSLAFCVVEEIAASTMRPGCYKTVCGHEKASFKKLRAGYERLGRAEALGAGLASWLAGGCERRVVCAGRALALRAVALACAAGCDGVGESLSSL